MDSQACDVLQQFEAPRLFIEASNTSKAHSLFVKDQVSFSLNHIKVNIFSFRGRNCHSIFLPF